MIVRVSLIARPLYDLWRETINAALELSQPIINDFDSNFKPNLVDNVHEGDLNATSGVILSVILTIVYQGLTIMISIQRHNNKFVSSAAL